MLETKPTLKKIDEMRATGYRPTVVCCLLHEGKFLFLFKKEFRLWMLPQGGIDAGLDPEDVCLTEIGEKLGKSFLKKVEKKCIYLGEDQIEFLPEKQTGEELTTADGKVYKMVGKHYYFYAFKVSTDEVDLTKTEFDEFYWLDFKPGLTLASKIYQPGKRRMTMKAVSLLKETGLIE
jgi:8-oxo-dGTP pyrophosphatase MutT (NUDIX family)